MLLFYKIFTKRNENKIEETLKIEDWDSAKKKTLLIFITGYCRSQRKLRPSLEVRILKVNLERRNQELLKVVRRSEHELTTPVSSLVTRPNLPVEAHGL